VKEGELGKAIGKKGANIQRVRTSFRKPVYVYENSEELHQFIKNLLAPVHVKNINIHEKSDSKAAYASIAEKDRGAAIGKGGEKIKLCRAILERKFGCDLRLVSE